MKRIILTSILLLSAMLNSNAWEFIQANSGKTNSLGKCSVTLQDFWSVHHNPAGFASYKDFSFGISYENKFLLKELGTKKAGLLLPTNYGTIGVSFSQFGYNHYNENIVGLGFARSFGSNLNIGLKFYYLFILFSDNYEKKSAPTFDVGIQYKINESLHIGAYLFNPANVKFRSIHKDKIPIIMRLGLSYFVNDNFLICSEIEENFNDNFSFRFGLEYEIYKDLFFRSGFQLMPELLTFGIGYNYKWFIADISAHMNQELGASLSCSLNFRIN